MPRSVRDTFCVQDTVLKMARVAIQLSPQPGEKSPISLVLNEVKKLAWGLEEAELRFQPGHSVSRTLNS